MKRRNYTREFKLSVLRELDNGKNSAEVCREHNLNQSVIQRWKNEYRTDPEKAFNGSGNLWKAEAEVEKYKRLVGQLYAENEFLKKTTERLQKLKAEQERMRSVK